MIKSNELRCGNTLHYLTAEGDVLPTTIDWQGIQWISENEKDFNTVHRPIPLTEEWHNRFGVKLNGFKQFQYDLTERKSVIFSGDYVYLVDIERMDGIRGLDDNVCTLWNNDLKRRNMYVHEWQNLYFALTQTELTT